MQATLISWQGRSFELQGNGEYVEVCEDDWCNDEPKDVNWDDESMKPSLLFLPVHEACLHVAKQVIRSRSRHLNADEYSGDLMATSMSRLWNILQTRFEATKRSKLSWYIPYVFGPHNYYMKGSIDLYDWETNSIDEKEV
jgi:hypothetical protein